MAWTEAQRRAVRLSRCKHFNGVQHATCGAGVVLRSVRDIVQSGPARWPCLTVPDREPLHTCPLYEGSTETDLEEEDRAVAAALAEMEERTRKR